MKYVLIQKYRYTSNYFGAYRGLWPRMFDLRCCIWWSPFCATCNGGAKKVPRLHHGFGTKGQWKHHE